MKTLAPLVVACLFRAHRLQRAGPAGLGSAGARLGRGDATGTPAA
jgi:hypothetical protein